MGEGGWIVKGDKAGFGEKFKHFSNFQASVNHLHLHCLYWPYESDLVHRRVETLTPTAISRDVFVIRRPEWYIPLLVFQLLSQEGLTSFVENIAHCAEYLTDVNQSHNLFMARAP